MIGFLSGKILNISERRIIIDVNGVGYSVTIGTKMKESLSEIGSPVKLFTHFVLNPRDGQVELYGFATAEELNFFNLLTTVDGIGPKSAQGILSNVDLQTLQLAILGGDDSQVRKVAGVGEKTAKRLILELQKKIAAVETSGKGGAEFSAQEDAVDALVALGYSSYIARDAIKQVSTKAKSTEDKIKEALQILGRK